MAKKKSSKKSPPKKKTRKVAAKKNVRKVKKPPQPKLTVAETIATMPIEDINALTTSYMDMKKLQDMVLKLRMGYKARLRDFEKKGLYSFAADKFENPKKGNILDPRTPGQIVEEYTKGLERGSQEYKEAVAEARNKLVHEFAKYQQFFQQKTSTVAGIREVNEQQMRQIQMMGGDSEGFDEMTQEELKEFWSVYDEFKAIADRASPYRSTESQQAVYQVMFNDTIDDREVFRSGVRIPYLEYEPGSRLYMIYKAKYLLDMERAKLEGQLAEEASKDVTTLSRGRGNPNSGRFSK